MRNNNTNEHGNHNKKNSMLQYAYSFHESAFWQNLVTGSIAGVGIAYSTFPAEAIKKYYQTTTNDSFRPYIKELYNAAKTGTLKSHLESTASQVKAGTFQPYNESLLHAMRTGSFKPYRGSLLFAVNIVPTTAIQWGTDSITKEYLPKDASLLQQLAASAFNGYVGAIAATPVENSVIRQQRMKSGAVEAVKDMLQHGASRPWRTYGLIGTRDAIFTMWMMSLMPAVDAYTKNNLDEQYHWPINFMTATLGAMASHPFDTVATNIQKSHEKIGALKMAQQLYKEGGVNAFYRGIGFRIFLFFAFSNGIPELKKAADYGIYNRGQLPTWFAKARDTFVSGTTTNSATTDASVVPPTPKK